MYWTEIYEWEPEEGHTPNVYQQLGFLSYSAREHFLNEVPDYKESEWGSSVENGKGAIVKLRAVLEGDGRWQAVVRCGFTGQQIHDSGREKFSTPEAAIAEALSLFETITLRGCADLEEQLVATHA